MTTLVRMDEPYCGTPTPARVPVPEVPEAVEVPEVSAGPLDPPPPGAAAGPPFAECVLCRKPTEYPESVKGSTLCPVCEWQEAQRTACSG